MRKTVLICGSRIWTDRATIARVMRELDPGTLIVHGAARGADRLADEVARDLGLPRKACPADWGQYGRAAGPIRNQQMLDLERPDRVLAFRVPGASPGTDDMIRRARTRGIRVSVFTPSESV